VNQITADSKKTGTIQDSINNGADGAAVQTGPQSL